MTNSFALSATSSLVSVVVCRMQNLLNPKPPSAHSILNGSRPTHGCSIEMSQLVHFFGFTGRLRVVVYNQRCTGLNWITGGAHYCQHGFRSQRSCEAQLVQFVHDIISNLDGAVNRGHKQTDLIIMDFAKAFDKVPHRRLLHKLDYYGIRGSTHKWINSWLSGRTQKVVLDGQASDPVPVLSGVPQGSVLGPVLFLIFINDLPDNIRSSVRLFADDCVLYRNIHSIQDCFILQEDLTSLGQWEADWQMKFNVAKCHSMRVTRHQHHKQILFDYSLHNQTLENVQSAKYLA